jgi:hypothetical protein
MSELESLDPVRRGPGRPPGSRSAPVGLVARDGLRVQLYSVRFREGFNAGSQFTNFQGTKIFVEVDPVLGRSVLVARFDHAGNHLPAKDIWFPWENVAFYTRMPEGGG